MIQMEMGDGTVFMPEDAQIVFTIGVGVDAKSFLWNDLKRVMLIDGEYGVADGKFGGPGGMPIRGVTWVDTSDLRVEIPMPLEAAQDLGKVLISSKVQIARSMPPSGLVVATRKPIITPPGS